MHFRRAFMFIDPGHFFRDDTVQRKTRQSAFTLIELLVVIAIIAILAIVVVATLNPVQLLQQSRDSNRLSDIANIQTAINVFQSDQPGASIGTASTTYVSIPDPTATSTAGDQCQGLGLPTLPPGYAYHCAATSSYRNVDGTGWIPANLKLTSGGTPLSLLPIDPINTSSSRLYYTYTTNGSQYELTSALESTKYKLGGSADAISTDGGTLATIYEKGSKLGLEPLDYGDASLVGYWTFDEGTASAVNDYSGSNASGTLNGTTVGTNGYYSAGKIGPWSGAFDGTTDFAAINPTLGPITNTLTVSAWVKRSVANTTGGIVNNSSSFAFGLGVSPCLSSANSVKLTKYSVVDICIGSFPADTNFHQLTAVWSNQGTFLYVDGQLNGTSTNSQNFTAPVATMRIGYDPNDLSYFTGLIDDVRIYTRALSAAEIQAMYNGGK